MTLELRVDGLSCPNCANELELEIRRLEHGQSAKLSYNTGKLTVDEKVDLDKVKRILRSDGATPRQLYRL